MLSQRILGPNTIIQGAVKTVLNSTPRQFFDNSISLVQVIRLRTYSTELLIENPDFLRFMQQTRVA